ncbi:MAG TPA: hypothetical protein PLC42_00300 [Parachlamydiaceae bacterium]|nr:hypothetical protein [Parachlamydiaceae bacterium]
MRWLKAFIAGIVVPTIILPIVLLIALYLGKSQILSVAFLHFIPVIWGIWNILYFAFFKNILPEDQNKRLYITGAVLGFLIAVYAIFWLDVPHLINLPESLRYAPLVLAPILYGILWRFLVKDLNEILYLKDSQKG